MSYADNVCRKDRGSYHEFYEKIPFEICIM